ncbi:class II aldolase/adducin family protein [Fimbriimonas ginsengisoli]|uniref:Class II aldolase/adducin family protein n=1 Tax=Fimbriimonas ginsengisoli Gsoil 348 TaxID=661478 RepID=A0A068NU78_FIMGI|nr:class II aldolase/adducin family protein [Fimbriimonas ginsengisoli]AIE86340.1 class II aldolase/adducin family protein [Fimbriimonas ginsengisoli Gsoil 348]
MLDELVALSRVLGTREHDLAILAEGNASARVDAETFYVKASGFSMCGIGPDGFVLVRSRPILDAFDGPELDDAGVRSLLATCTDSEKRLPSVETFMHAYLLSLPDVHVVGHTHPTPLISLLSLEDAPQIASQRLFPDEVVLCGPESCYVPYADPGLPLALGIRTAVVEYAQRLGSLPKTIWLQNHGLIVLGKSTREVESGTLMAAKAARAWLGALSTGRPIHTMSADQVARIHNRPDEHYRQKLLWELRSA